MRKYATWLCVVLVLAFVAGMAYAQRGDRPKGPSGWSTPGHAPTVLRRHIGPRMPAVEPPAPAPTPPPAVSEPSPGPASHPWAGPCAGTAHCPFAGRYGPLWTHLRHAGRVLLFLLVAVPVLVTLFWVLPIMLGVRVARRRNLSPLWMLFGINPLGGWIACLVLALARGKVECASCGGYVKRNFRQCPFCKSPIEGGKSSKSDK